MFKEIEEPSHEPIKNKTQEVSETFCVNCHNYKQEISKLLKQETEQQISIDKLEETNKMQTSINNLHEDITKLKDDKQEINKLLKHKTEQQISIDKLEETNKMQTSINNLHEDITKLKDDTEITKSKMFSY